MSSIGIIDANPDQCLLVRRSLEDEGCTVAEAANEQGRRQLVEGTPKSTNGGFPESDTGVGYDRIVAALNGISSDSLLQAAKNAVQIALANPQEETSRCLLYQIATHYDLEMK